MENKLKYDELKDYILHYAPSRKNAKILKEYTKIAGDHKYLVNDPLWEHLSNFNFPFLIQWSNNISWDLDLIMRLIFSSSNIKYSFHNVKSEEIRLKIMVFSKYGIQKISKFLDELPEENFFQFVAVLLKEQMKDQLEIIKNPSNKEIQNKRDKAVHTFNEHLFHLCLIKNFQKHSLSLERLKSDFRNF